DYDNNIWLYGFWSTGGAVYSLAHHEYYRYCSPYVANANSTVNRYWTSGIHHLSSLDGGNLFLPKPYYPYRLTGKPNSSRLVLVPQPSSAYSNFGVYGPMMPSNIAYENGYYYAFADYLEPTDSSSTRVRSGIIMYRTTKIESPEGWEVLTASGWSSAY